MLAPHLRKYRYRQKGKLTPKATNNGWLTDRKKNHIAKLDDHVNKRQVNLCAKEKKQQRWRNKDTRQVTNDCIA